MLPVSHMLSSLEGKASAVLAERKGLPVGPPQPNDRNVYRAQLSDGRERFDIPILQRIHAGPELEWLWPGKIPAQRLTVLQGDEGAGKSFVAMDLVARVTTGMAWPDQQAGQPPAPECDTAVLVIGRAENYQDQTRRLAGLGADLAKIRWWQRFDTFILQGSVTDRRPLELSADLPALAQEVRELQGLKLVVIDSLVDVCPSPHEAAWVLRQLNLLALEMKVAVVVTLPARCRFDAQGQLRVTSRFNTEGARHVWCVTTDPQDPRRRLLLPRRINEIEHSTGLAFRVTNGRVDWHTPQPLAQYDPLGYWQELETFLGDVMRPGSLAATEIFRQGSQLGFSPKQLRAGARRLGIESHKSGGFGAEGSWMWFTREQRTALEGGTELAALPAAAGVTPVVAAAAPSAVPEPVAAPAAAPVANPPPVVRRETLESPESLEKYRKMSDDIIAEVYQGKPATRRPEPDGLPAWKRPKRGLVKAR